MSVQSSDTANNSVIRENLVETAAKFLQNPNVQKTSLSEQQRFLRRKGLTDDEIQLACEKSGAYTYHEKNQTSPLVNDFVVPQHTYGQLSLFDKIKEILQNFASIAFVVYAIYKFYEKYVAPYFFGKKKKNIEQSLDELDKNVKDSMQQLQNNLTNVKIEVDKINRGTENNTQRQLSDLKSDISTIKGLLLSRNQFPPVTKSSVLKPSIPEWQKHSHDSDPDSDPERKVEELMEVCSGSGSEHNTQKSDSSLEIISYSSKDSDIQRQKCKNNDDDEE